MKTLAVLTLLIATVSLTPAALATADLPVGVNDCDGGNVCVLARTEPAVCAGVGFGLQGIVGCVTDEECVVVYVGFHRETACPIDLS